jgi:hypothetical protein
LDKDKKQGPEELVLDIADMEPFGCAINNNNNIAFCPKQVRVG